jgi:hypothetical protein
MSLVNAEWRTANYFRQFKGALAYRAGATIVSIITVPVLINHMGLEVFGVWSTLIAFASWLALLDFGIANSLRNKVTDALATDACDTDLSGFIGPFSFRNVGSGC